MPLAARPLDRVPIESRVRDQGEAKKLAQADRGSGTATR